MSFPTNEIWNQLHPADAWQGNWIDFRHSDQSGLVNSLGRAAKVPIELGRAGLSDEGRILHTLTLGAGQRRVLVWARQHGDEPDCTAGLMMTLHALLHPDFAECGLAPILEKLRLCVMPMVNPDGVSRFTRRNAQGIDINRDAQAQATPEGRALLGVRTSFDPEVCFNLHDMDRRKVLENGELAAFAFQACPFDATDADSPARLRAKRLCALMAGAAGVHSGGHVGRYAADFMPHAFGDNTAAAGPASVLMEAGGWFDDRGGDVFVRRLYALFLLRGLYAVAMNEDETANAAEYDCLPFDTPGRFTDLRITGTEVLNGAGRPPFRADVSVNRHQEMQRESHRDPPATIEGLGDLSHDRTMATVPLPGAILLPGLTAYAPSYRFSGDIPSEEEAAAFLRAGITTVACGFGPFASTRARDQWMEFVQWKRPPLNIVAFERVPGLREVFARHGQTELAGLLVQDLEVASEDLLRLSHLFHRAQPVVADESETGRTVAADLFLLGAPSPGGIHVHLHLTPVTDQKGLTQVRADDFERLSDDFLQSPGQVTFSVDALEAPLDWLPVLTGYGGLSHGRPPHPEFLSNIMRYEGATEGSGMVGAANKLLLHGGRLLRYGRMGTVEVGNRADLAAFASSLGEGEARPPDFVMLNGYAVVANGVEDLRRARGEWFFAQGMTGR